MKTLVEAAEPEDRSPFGPQVTLTSNTETSAIVTWRNDMGFVCENCKSGDHTNCPGGTQCDCQHRGQK